MRTQAELKVARKNKSHCPWPSGSIPKFPFDSYAERIFFPEIISLFLTFHSPFLRLKSPVLIKGIKF
jgi:hypothetical protein